ncbi:5774_t:CDS:2 [Gigaspora rosea]|nr:5774_t:CDS:2 [Gigaspora rosea]
MPQLLSMNHKPYTPWIFGQIHSRLKLNLEKCKLLKPNIQFLEHIVGSKEIEPDPSKLKKCFIPEFATTDKALYHLLEKDIKYVWSEEQEEAFKKLKTHLITAPVLRYLDYSKTFYLYTDTSRVGLRAILAQKDEDKKEYAIAYASKSLTQAERNYAATKLESDHTALKWLQNTVPKGRREIEAFSIMIENSSFDNSDDELSNWTEEDSGGWFDKEEELLLDEENEMNDSGYSSQEYEWELTNSQKEQDRYQKELLQQLAYELW